MAIYRGYGNRLFLLFCTCSIVIVILWGCIMYKIGGRKSNLKGKDTLYIENSVSMHMDTLHVVIDGKVDAELHPRVFMHKVKMDTIR